MLSVVTVGPWLIIDSPLIVMDYAFASKLIQISSSVTWKLSWKEVPLLPILKTRHPRLALLAGSFVITVRLSSNDLYTSMPLSTSLSKLVSSLALQKLFQFNVKNEIILRKTFENILLGCLSRRPKHQ
jgi:hypothetical protein